MKKKCVFYNYQMGDCRLGSNECAYGYSGCPIILNEDKDYVNDRNSKSSCKFCKREKGSCLYFCESKNSEWYGEYCVECDTLEYTYCDDKEKK